MTFWNWFFRGGTGRGWRKFVDAWLVLHIAVGIIFAYLVPSDLTTAASTVLLPLVGILIGLSFAWAANAQSLLQTDEIEALTEYREGGFEEYVYTYLTAVLIILVSVTVWGVAALGIFDLPCPWECPIALYPLARILLFTILSITIRECWHVVLSVQLMLVMRRRIRESSDK